jgi:hypothetical protein
MYDVHVDDYQIVLRFRCDGSPDNGLAVFERSHNSDDDWDIKMSQHSESNSMNGFPEWVYERNPTFYETSYGVKLQ